MHRGMLKCSQFSLASSNQWSFLIWQRTAALKRNSVPFNQLIGCFKKDLISLSCLSVIQHILVYKSQVCLMMQFLCNKHTAASRTFPCCSNHLVSNIKLFVIFLCAFALNKHIFLSSRPRLVFLMRLLLLLFFVAASSWLRFDVIVCHCLSSFVCSSLWILFVSRIHFVFYSLCSRSLWKYSRIVCYWVHRGGLMRHLLLQYSHTSCRSFTVSPAGLSKT